jgi:hypothetical protein
MFTYTKQFPCNNEKKPLTENGFKDASDSPDVHKKWQQTFRSIPYWGFPTGDGIFVLDVDVEGLENWKEMTQCHGEPTTFTVQTRSGGYHYYFGMPTGTVVRNSQDTGNTEKIFATGIDIRGEGGYVIMPNGKDYKVINDANVAYPPEWIINRLAEMKRIGMSKQGRFALPTTIPNGSRDGTIFTYGCSLQAKGKSDEEIRDLMTKANDERCDPPLTEAELEKKIEQVLKYPKGTSDFKPNLHGVNGASAKATPAEYRSAMIGMGYHFRLNEADDTIYSNGHPLSDIDEQELFYNMGNLGFTSTEKTVQAYSTEAKANKFHPVREYLESLTWDGVDYIGRMAEYFVDEEGVFELYLRKWLVGCVAKVLPVARGVQNRTFVLAGNQNLGKSYFPRWLCRDLPRYHIEGSIHPEDKDDHLRKIGMWIWEVPELGATTRKADLEALKDFQSAETVVVRKSYGRRDIHKPALANFLATVNPDGMGFLNDPTGSRRYMTSTLKAIDWRYSQEIDPKQLWAQAVALLESGYDWKLSDEEAHQAEGINSEYKVETPVSQYLARYFDIDPNQNDWLMPTIEIIEHLRKQEAISINDKAVAMDISKALGGKLRKKRMTPRGYNQPVVCWFGINPKDPYTRPLNVVKPLSSGGSPTDDL